MECYMRKFRSKFDTLNPHVRYVHNLGRIEVDFKYLNMTKSRSVGNRRNNTSGNHDLLHSYRILVSEASSRDCTFERRMKIRKELSEIRRQKRRTRYAAIK